VLHSFSFTGGSDGGAPVAGLIADTSGALYGTTSEGGIGNNGTVFKLTPPAKGQTTWTETVLYRFTGSDGSGPVAGLIADNLGALFGTTLNGGISNNGTVFKLTPPGVRPVGQRPCSIDSARSQAAATAMRLGLA